MNIVFWIIVGVIIGWVVEWIVDWLFWRRGGEGLAEKLAQAEAENRRLREQLAEAEQQAVRFNALEDEAKICRAKLADAEVTVERLRAELNAVAGQSPQEEDCFERINGIGATFADRFNDAGILTFAQLADSTPERVQEVARPEEWQKVEPKGWIARAKELATEKAEAFQRILSQHQAQEQLQEKLAQLETENGRLLSLTAADKSVNLAALEGQTSPVGLAEKKVDLAQFQPDFGQAPPHRDRLEEIDGIGPSFARRFNEAGIYSFAQLALLMPERVREIIKPEKWQKIEPESWIAQAKTRVDKDPLKDIVGVGDLYARRLNEAGIYSFAQLVTLTPEQVREVVKAEGPIDAESWIEQARGFAAKKVQTRAAFGTRARGLTLHKDPLVDIEGIGPVYVQRLNEAGVFTFWQLARLTPAQIQEIIKPEGWQKIEPESWITQAKAMAEPDQLDEIDGIGSVYAQRLNEAGIYTFAQLAALTPAEIQEFVEAEGWQYANAADWIAQAKEIMAKRALQSS